MLALSAGKVPNQPWVGMMDDRRLTVILLPITPHATSEAAQMVVGRIARPFKEIPTHAEAIKSVGKMIPFPACPADHASIFQRHATLNLSSRSKRC